MWATLSWSGLRWPDTIAEQVDIIPKVKRTCQRELYHPVPNLSPAPSFLRLPAAPPSANKKYMYQLEKLSNPPSLPPHSEPYL